MILIATESVVPVLQFFVFEASFTHSSIHLPTCSPSHSSTHTLTPTYLLTHWVTHSHLPTSFTTHPSTGPSLLIPMVKHERRDGTSSSSPYLVLQDWEQRRCRPERWAAHTHSTWCDEMCLLFVLHRIARMMSMRTCTCWNWRETYPRLCEFAALCHESQLSVLCNAVSDIDDGQSQFNSGFKFCNLYMMHKHWE